MSKLRVKDSNRPRPGRRFLPVEELQLTPDAMRAIRGLPGAHREVSVFREVAGPFGIPDFLAVIGPQTALRERLALGVPPLLNEIDAAIVAQTSPKSGKTIEKVANKLGWPLSTVQRRIPGLLRNGALRDVGQGRYVRPSALSTIGRLYAIETKVRNFKRALRQARTYALWCDNYVIVMPQLSEAALFSAREALAADRGGLVMAGRWVQRIRTSDLPPTRRLWGSEHVVAAALDIPSHSPPLSSSK